MTEISDKRKELEDGWYINDEVEYHNGKIAGFEIGVESAQKEFLDKLELIYSSECFEEFKMLIHREIKELKKAVKE